MVTVDKAEDLCCGRLIRIESVLVYLAPGERKLIRPANGAALLIKRDGEQPNSAGHQAQKQRPDSDLSSRLYVSVNTNRNILNSLVLSSFSYGFPRNRAIIVASLEHNRFGSITRRVSGSD